jgi:hypothetical protein
MNVERVYHTNVPVAELAQAMADHFRVKGFETQVFEATDNRTVVQARKDDLWRQLLGVAYAVTVILSSKDGRLVVSLGGHEWVDTAISAGIGLVAVPPVLLGTAYGIWKENQLDQEAWRVIDERINAGLATPSAMPV